MSQLAEATGVDEEEVLTRIEKLSEVNPMLGFRGCRQNYPTALALISSFSFLLPTMISSISAIAV